MSGFTPKAGAIYATILPQFILSSGSLCRLLLLMCAYEAILFTCPRLYGYLLSRAGQSRFGRRIQV